MCLCWGQDNHVKECNYLDGKTIILESNVDVLNTGTLVFLLREQVVLREQGNK